MFSGWSCLDAIGFCAFHVNFGTIVGTEVPTSSSLRRWLHQGVLFAKRFAWDVDHRRESKTHLLNEATKRDDNVYMFEWQEIASKADGVAGARAQHIHEFNWIERISCVWRASKLSDANLILMNLIDRALTLITELTVLLLKKKITNGKRENGSELSQSRTNREWKQKTKLRKQSRDCDHTQKWSKCKIAYFLLFITVYVSQMILKWIYYSFSLTFQDLLFNQNTQTLSLYYILISLL